MNLISNRMILNCLLLILAISCSNTVESYILAENINYVSSKAPLVENPYIQLPLGSIKPQGWLLEQLHLSAKGMTGHLDEIWRDVGPDNGWLGGQGDAWERGPYWLDGLLPLAYILSDGELIEKANKWVEAVLASQREDGYFGPIPDNTRTFGDSRWERRQAWQEKAKMDWWPHMVMLKVLQQYYEATGDQRVPVFMTRYFKYQYKWLPKRHLNFWTHWAKSRGGENLASIYWLYNRTGDEFLLDLGRLVFEQTLDWTARFTGGYPDSWHGVNSAMGVKQPAVWYQYAGDKKYLESVKQGIQALMKYHGQVEGLWSGDELLHGTDPTHGTELCTVVEYMFSLESLIQITGDPDYMDMLERVAFNALPAQLKADFTGRQYYQMPNQISCDTGWHNFSTKHQETESLFGLETGYGCCTANYHQGWPKFSANLWNATQDNGLAALIYAPSRVTAKVANGIKVTFAEETVYPFSDRIKFIYEKGQKVFFPLHLHIPSWCKSAVIKVNGTEYSRPRAGTIEKVIRLWKEGDMIELHLPMDVRTSHWHERAASVERGPLVFALGIEEEWEKIEGDGSYATYAVHPRSEWNYGILREYIDYPDSLFTLETKGVAAQPWKMGDSPVRLIAKARKIPQWQRYGGVTGPIPYSPHWRNIKVDTPVEEITLIPYGCTKLRISEFPVVK